MPARRKARQLKLTFVLIDLRIMIRATIMAMKPRPYLSAAFALAFLLVGTGCGQSEEDRIAKILANRKKGGHIRLVNLSESNTRLMFGPRQFTQAAPGESTPYALYSPGDHDAQVMAGEPEKSYAVKLSVQSEGTSTLYFLEAKTGRYLVLGGDEVRAPDDAASVRLVNLTKEPVRMNSGDGKIDLSADAEAGSEIAKTSPGPIALNIGSDMKVEAELEDASAYCVVVFAKDGRLDHVVLKSNRKMEMQSEGASPSG